MNDIMVELGLDVGGESDVECAQESLRFAGLTADGVESLSQMTSAPRVVLATAESMPEGAAQLARDIVGTMLPARLDVCGILALGDGPEVSLAYLVEPDPELAEAVGRLRAAVPGLRRAVWLPHVTVAHQVPRRKVPEAMAELGGIPGSFFATQLRYVDTRAHEAQTLVGVSSSVL
jgi:hypothetical protein